MGSQPLVYIDRSTVNPGATAGLKAAIADLVRFVEAREPRLAVYGFHLDEAASTMSVVAVHPDSASLEIAGPEFIRLRQIEVFGSPSQHAVSQLRDKAAMLGGAEVIVRPAEAGFARIRTL